MVLRWMLLPTFFFGYLDHHRAILDEDVSEMDAPFSFVPILFFGDLRPSQGISLILDPEWTDLGKLNVHTHMAQNRIQITLESNAKCTEVCRHRTTYIHKVLGIQNTISSNGSRIQYLLYQRPMSLPLQTEYRC
ncbi:uncharacterized protein LOC113469493 [Diaphorina citri]|uniref:Uncharacterized protein LOC113469493 n=1 Tax=Diaphorina citri TaxID=121845 RepID=A0A3Q0J3J7_DIACI|nr:uncharacterized protein LOC113469493 [Diaphorina citri]